MGTLGTSHHPDLAGVPPPTIQTWLGFPPTIQTWSGVPWVSPRSTPKQGTPHHPDLAGLPPPPSRPGMEYPPPPPSRPGWGISPPRPVMGYPPPPIEVLAMLLCLMGGGGVPWVPPPPSRPGWGITSIQTCNGVPPPVEVWTGTQSENITFPHPSDAGGNNKYLFSPKFQHVQSDNWYENQLVRQQNPLVADQC